MTSPPLVTAVMITGKTPDHEKMARVAVDCFLNQTYTTRELLIINDGPYELRIGHPSVREVLIKDPTRKTLGELRNLGIKEARGDWIIQWDDDDYHHPHRILYQMAHRSPGCAVVLLKQLRVDEKFGEAICVQCDEGIAGTILHPRSTDVRYPAIPKGEDNSFMGGFKRIVVDNNGETWPGPCLYVRRYHGLNTWDYENVMGGKESYSRRWVPNGEQRKFIGKVMEKYGWRIESWTN
jgi:glycosyltransferase involved in cell wall biosynthesis